MNEMSPCLPPVSKGEFKRIVNNSSHNRTVNVKKNVPKVVREDDDIQKVE